jgi:hypothetical protein
MVQAYADAPNTDPAFLNQLWLVKPTSSGYYSFRSLRGGTYLDLSGGELSLESNKATWLDDIKATRPILPRYPGIRVRGLMVAFLPIKSGRYSGRVNFIS